MRELPILFRGELVREILADRKNQTRRPVKDFPEPDVAALLAIENGVATFGHSIPDDPVPVEVRCPYGAPGDRLWVRESWADGRRIYPFDPFIFRASTDAYDEETCRKEDDRFRWRPSIHMPRRAARLVLDVLDVRVERLQAITEEDARAEGVADRAAFFEKWESMYRRGPFAADRNPWVWVVSFRRVDAARSVA